MKRSIFIVLAAQSWSSVKVGDVAIEPPFGAPSWWLAAFDTRDAAQKWSGGKPVIEATYDDGTGPRGKRKGKVRK